MDCNRCYPERGAGLWYRCSVCGQLWWRYPGTYIWFKVSQKVLDSLIDGSPEPKTIRNDNEIVFLNLPPQEDDQSRGE